MGLNGAKLTLEADPDQDTNKETGVFEMDAGQDLNIEIFSRTGKLLSGGGGTVISIYNGLFESGDSERESLFVDLGGGAFGCTISFNNWEGSDKQWGNDSNTGLTAASATGQSPLEQMSVLMRYLSTGEFDSRNTNSQFEVAEWSSSGNYSPWSPIALEEPSVNFDVSDPTILSGSFTIFNARGVSVGGASTEQND